MIPPPGRSLHALLRKLISQTVPSLFPGLEQLPPVFDPHVTLTSEIPPTLYGSEAQAWLDSLSFPVSGDVKVNFERVDTEGFFFRKCTIRVSKLTGLSKLASECRRVGVYGEDERKTAEWLQSTYRPHCSLM